MKLMSVEELKVDAAEMAKDVYKRILILILGEMPEKYDMSYTLGFWESLFNGRRLNPSWEDYQEVLSTLDNTGYILYQNYYLHFKISPMHLTTSLDEEVTFDIFCNIAKNHNFIGNVISFQSMFTYPDDFTLTKKGIDAIVDGINSAVADFDSALNKQNREKLQVDYDHHSSMAAILKAKLKENK